jgi:hypothetical protein
MVNMYNVFSWQRVAANLHENECHKEKLVIYKPSTLAKKKTWQGLGTHSS